MSKPVSDEKVINITAPNQLVQDAEVKFNETQIAFVGKGSKLNKKTYYAYLVHRGLEHFSEKSLEKYMKNSQ